MLLIKNAHVVNQPTPVDILIDDQGKYAKIEPKLDVPDASVEVIDAKGMLTAPTFVNTHMHFDKSYTSLGGREDSTETLEDSISIMHDRIRAYTVEDVKARVCVQSANVSLLARRSFARTLISAILILILLR